MPRQEPVRHQGPVDAAHLINEHGLSKRAVKAKQGTNPGANRHLTLYLEMQHGFDHAQRVVGHEHN